MDLTYVALRKLKVGDDFRLPGDEVPEAKDWVNKESYVSRGYLGLVEKKRGPGRPKADEQA